VLFVGAGRRTAGKQMTCKVKNGSGSLIYSYKEFLLVTYYASEKVSSRFADNQEACTIAKLKNTLHWNFYIILVRTPTYCNYIFANRNSVKVYFYFEVVK